MIRKFLFYTTVIFPMIICVLVLETFSWIRKQVHGYFDWVVKE